MKIIFFLIILVAFFEYSCKEKKVENSLGFNIDNSLLKSEFVDSLAGINLRAPLGWDDLSNDKNKKLKYRLNLDFKKGADIKAFYIDTVNQACLIVSNLNLLTDRDIKHIFNNPDSSYNLDKKWEQIMKSEYILNGLDVTQFLLQNAQIINFKLILRNGDNKIYQVDYLSGREMYLKNVKKIESSIGTINLK